LAGKNHLKNRSKIILETLEILYKDDHLVAVNKPHGLLVHRSGMAAQAEEFALQLVRNQLQQKVFPTHRLDRKTSGVLLFALSEEINSQIQKKFANHEIRKSYVAIVRGFTPDSGEIDYPLANLKGKIQNALTHFRTLQTTEIDVPFGKFPTSRYSMVHITPKTGRYHQIRKHFAHIFHPIIGDRPHGCNKQNRFFKERWEMDTMLLHAYELEFEHPVNGQLVRITAPVQKEFLRSFDFLEFDRNLFPHLWKVLVP
jgi:tRNA pseudouridine65 synthase